MASETFYIFIGTFSMIAFVMGFSMAGQTWGEPMIPVIGGYVKIVGVVFAMVLGIAAFFDIKNRVKEWRIDTRYDSLGTKDAEIDLKRRELEIKKKEEEFKREQKHIKEQHKREKQEEKKRYEEQKRREKLEQERKESVSEKLDQKYSEPNFADKPKMQSFGGVPEEFKKRPEPIQNESSIEKSVSAKESEKQPKLIPTSEFTDELFKSSNEPIRILWYIYQNDGEFANQSDGAKIVFGKNQSGYRNRIKSTMEEFEDEYGMIKSKLANPREKKSPKKYMLTVFGRRMIEEAMNNNISDWDSFYEKMETELEREKMPDELERCEF